MIYFNWLIERGFYNDSQLIILYCYKSNMENGASFKSVITNNKTKLVLLNPNYYLHIFLILEF